MGSPIACRLDVLNAEQRRREQELLAVARAELSPPVETEAGYRFAVRPELLGPIGELLALERRCCPFLAFTLEVEAEQGGVFLHIHGQPGAKAFIASTFASR